MNENLAEIIEKLHNVTVDSGHDTFNLGDLSEYGWQPIPKKWIAEAKTIFREENGA